MEGKGFSFLLQIHSKLHRTIGNAISFSRRKVLYSHFFNITINIHLIFQISKGRLHGFTELLIIRFDFGLTILDWIFEFHGRKLV